MSNEADHVLIVYDAAYTRDDEAAEVHKVYGPLGEQAAKDLGETVRSMAVGRLRYDVKPIERSPLMLTDIGRQARRRST